MLRLRSPGPLVMIAGLQLLVLLHVSEFLYPGYSVSSNYISDLGVGPWPSWGIFTASVLLFGLLVLLTAALLYEHQRSLLWLLFALSGIGAVGVAVFNESFGLTHAFFALLAFGFGNMAAIYSFKVTRAPFSYISLSLGVVGLSALFMTIAGIDLGLGAGGIERMIFYPGVLWAISYGAYLLATE